MAEEGAEGLVEYKLETSNGHVLNESKDYNGKGKATYPNGDTYDGEFKNGVSRYITYILSLLIVIFEFIVESWRRWYLYICIKTKARRGRW